MSTPGLFATGLSIATAEEIRAEIVQDLQNAFGPSIDVNTGILARFIGILVERYALLNEMLETVYNAGNPDTATGIALDTLCLLTGTLRAEATASAVVLTLTGTPATVVPAAQQVSTRSNNGINKFLTGASGTLVALTAWVASTFYNANARVTSHGHSYQCATSGTSASSGGPSAVIVGGVETDGTVTWLFLGDGVGAIDVIGQSVLTGPIVGASRDITNIDQPYGGWNGVINVLDAVVGTNDQVDEALRLIREAELAQPGAGTAAAIRAALLTITGVTAVTVFVNNTDTTDGNGVTPHSIETLVQGGADADIGAMLLQQVAAGINTVGTTTTSPVDSQGVTQTIKFSRPSIFDIGVTITLVKVPNNPADTTTYPTDGDTQVKAAIVAYGAAQLAGKNAVASAIAAQAFQVPGVLDVSSTLISSVASPGVPPTPTLSTTIAISTRQLAKFDTSWITVVTSDGTP
jgi:uncharacterized phage protein gp47/JayE